MAQVTGGDKLAKKLRELGKLVDRKTTLRVGFLENARYPDGTPVAMVAFIQDSGAPRAGIPPRPFFRNMIAAKSPGWPDALANILKMTGYDPVKALEIFGEGVADQLVTAITEFDGVPLSAVTLMLRKMRADDPSLQVTGATVGEAARRVAAGQSAAGVSDKQLVDTKFMLRSVDKEVSQ